MVGSARRKQLAGLLGIWVALGMGGCNKQKKTDEGKTYTPKAQGAQGGGAQSGSGSSGSGQSDAKPLDAPADTTNGKASKSSDSGASDATRGQVVSEPGAPVEHDAEQKPAPKPPAPGGHS